MSSTSVLTYSCGNASNNVAFASAQADEAGAPLGDPALDDIQRHRHVDSAHGNAENVDLFQNRRRHACHVFASPRTWARRARGHSMVIYPGRPRKRQDASDAARSRSRGFLTKTLKDSFRNTPGKHNLLRFHGFSFHGTQPIPAVSPAIRRRQATRTSPSRRATSFSNRLPRCSDWPIVFSPAPW